MKPNYILLLFLTASLMSNAQSSQFANNGFENWNTLHLFDYLTDWTTSNEIEYYEAPNVLQSTDASDGSSSVELQSVLFNNDTIFGYVFHGSFGPMGPDGGIAYSSDIDEIRFQYKCDMMPGDSLYVLLIRYDLGAVVGTDLVPVAWGTSNSWTLGSGAFSTGTQEEIFIGFVLGDPFGVASPTPTSWARIDEVSLYNNSVAAPNLPDPSFENWDALDTEVPTNWYTLNNFLVPLGMENARLSTDAYSGSYSVELETIEDPQSGDTIASVLSNGPIDWFATNPFTPVPYVATPTQLSGYYKYMPQNGDEAAIEITFFNNGTDVGSYAQNITDTPNWQAFSFPLSISMQADSMSIYAYSGDNPGSILRIDDLQLSGGDVGIDVFSNMDVSMYPNPSKDVFYVKAEGNYAVFIRNMNGQLVERIDNCLGSIQIHTSHFQSGMYLVEVRGESQAEELKLIIQ